MTEIVRDFRHLQRPAGPPPKKLKNGTLSYPGKIVRGKLVERDATTIDGITLHQTAAIYGPTKEALKLTNGDRTEAVLHRALGVHAHATAFQSGFAVIAYPLRSYVWHGNGFNPTDLGLEFEWKDMTGTVETLPEQLIVSGRAAIDWFCENTPKEGIQLKYINAHRQSSPTRRADPGKGIWVEIALWAAKKWGLQLRPTLVLGKGRPIPKDWQKDGVGNY